MFNMKHDRLRTTRPNPGMFVLILNAFPKFNLNTEFQLNYS